VPLDRMEVTMDDGLASAPHQAERPGMPVESADVSRRYPATLRGIVETWRWRIHFRWELEQKLKDNAHLVDDIGLTRRQLGAEIAKRFWQA